MGSLRLLGLMAMLQLLILLPMIAIAKGNLVDDFLGKVCEEVECGKGKCVVNSSLPLGFMCECDNGWTQIRDDHDNQTYPDNFLPCVIPQCQIFISFPQIQLNFNISFSPIYTQTLITNLCVAHQIFAGSLNYGCQPAPPPVSDKVYPYNLSAFNPCNWVYCGEGKCTRNFTLTHRHTCECNSGYFNLLNISVFPCYSQCTIGSDCSKLGIKVADSTTSGQGQGSSMVAGRLQWMVMLLMSMGVVMWT